MIGQAHGGTGKNIPTPGSMRMLQRLNAIKDMVLGQENARLVALY